MAIRARRAAGTWPVAARIAHASARSSPGPALRRSPGARLAVMRRRGHSKPLLRIAVWIRSRASRTAASASPTIANAGSPARTSSSTTTWRAFGPSSVNV
jgi:hypothetical protein